ncbi:MAG: molybdopterin molybdotransferase [Gaiellaceae bacterium]|nr:molybdopterin molybdotransferase [Gaiellaceae bacterium]
MQQLLAIDEALALILARVEPLPAEPVPVRDAAGRVLATPALAVVDLPPFPSSAMDGYAVRVADVPATLPIGARIAAGRPAPRALVPGETMAIATGAVVPDGADAVIPIEYVVEHDNNVEFSSAVDVGANVRPRGGDLRAGEPVVDPGVRLGPAQLGALSAAGIAEVACARRPRAAVLTTGTELRPPGQPLAPGQVYEANGTILAAALASAGADVEVLPPVPDDEDAHRRALEHGLGSDLLVSSGGVSVGPHDLVRDVGRSLGVEEVFWRVAVKPGKPIAFGVRGRTLVFGLPGNPVSSLVGFELFVRPAVLALQGLRDPGPHFHVGRLAASLRRSEGRDELVRARSSVDGAGVVLEPLRGQESHMIARAAAADALVFVPRGEGELAAGESVRFLRLG